MRRYVSTALGACAAFGLSALMIAWLARSSEHADRPPLFAVVALLVAVVAGLLGVMLTVRMANDALRNPSRKSPE